MKVLGIETSCDDSACSVVEDGTTVLSYALSSQIDIHSKTGGVVPEVAAREHILNILPVLDQSLSSAGLSWDDIDAIAVTKGPGLISSLIIGTETASVISYVKNLPLIPVQHIKGHIFSNWLDRKGDEPKFPLIVLTVSGGHNELILMRDYDDFEVLGETIDDAAGEAYDKVARILGLGYPGGPIISKMALDGNPDKFDLPRSWMGKDNLNFSFSGLKTSILNLFKDYIDKNNISSHLGLDPKFISDLSASFQKACNEVLAKKLLIAFLKNPDVKEVHLAGGVSANQNLRFEIEKLFEGRIKFRYPVHIKYCTDNASMIASAGYFLYKYYGEKKFERKFNIVPSTSFKI